MQKILAYFLSMAKLDRSALLNVFAYASVGFVFVGLSGVLTNLYLIELGLELSFIGALTASGMLIWALFSIPAGMIGARFGLRAAVVAGFMVLSIGMALYLSVERLPRSLWEMGFYLTNAVTFIGGSLVAVNGAPYLMAVAPENERNMVFTLGGALNALTGFTGSLVAGFLPGILMRASAGSLGLAGAYNSVLWLSVPVYLVSGVLMVKARSAPPVIEETHAAAEKTQPPVGLLLFLGLLFATQFMSENFVILFYNVYLGKELSLPTGQIGTIFAVGRLLPFFISPLLPLALSRWGAGRVMNSVYVCLVFLILLLAWIPAWQAAAAGFVLISILTSFSVTARSIYGLEIVQPRWRTIVSAVNIISLAIAMGVTGIIGGNAIPLIGFRGMFLIGSGLSLLAVLFFVIWQVRSSRRAPVAEYEPAEPV